MSQENLQTTIMQIFLGLKEVYYGIVQVVNKKIPKLTFPALVLRVTLYDLIHVWFSSVELKGPGCFSFWPQLLKERLLSSVG